MSHDHSPIQVDVLLCRLADGKVKRMAVGFSTRKMTEWPQMLYWWRIFIDAVSSINKVVTRNLTLEKLSQCPETATRFGSYVCEMHNRGEWLMRKSLCLVIALSGLGISLEAAHVESVPSATKETSTTIQQARSVKGRVLTSTETPAVRLEFD